MANMCDSSKMVWGLPKCPDEKEVKQFHDIISIKNCTKVTSTDVVEILLSCRFEGTHEDHDKDCYVERKALINGFKELIKAHTNKKIKLTDDELFNLTKMFHCKGKGIQVVAVIEECFENKSDFWRLERRRMEKEKHERSMVQGTQKHASTYGHALLLRELVKLVVWDYEGKDTFAIRIGAEGKEFKPLYFKKKDTLKSMKDCRTLLNSRYRSRDKFHCGVYYAECRKDYNIKKEHEDVMWGHKCERIVMMNLITLDNGVPKVKEVEDMELCEVQKPLDLIPPPLVKYRPNSRSRKPI
ncbi:hypothetical protein ACHAXS_001322 [Conticribra weissflogii]